MQFAFDISNLLSLAAGVKSDGWGLSLSAQWGLVWFVAIGFLVAPSILNRTTRFGVIAKGTAREAIRQPIYILLLVLGILMMALNAWIPFFSMGNDTKMYIELGISTIFVCCALLAIWTASMSIAEEIEGKTAMTLLSKPINRRQFILGKFIGIMQGVLWLLIPLFIVFIIFIYLKSGYDHREAGKGNIAMFNWVTYDWGAILIDIPMFKSERLEPIFNVMPGLILIFLQVSLLTAVSVAISTRLPMIVNLVACTAIFIVSNLTPVIVQSAEANADNKVVSVLVQMFASLFALIFPQLEYFNMQTSISIGVVVPPEYLAFCALYTICFCTIMILFAFILFEDRDLA